MVNIFIVFANNTSFFATINIVAVHLHDSHYHVISAGITFININIICCYYFIIIPIIIVLDIIIIIISIMLSRNYFVTVIVFYHWYYICHYHHHYYRYQSFLFLSTSLSFIIMIFIAIFNSFNSVAFSLSVPIIYSCIST